MLIILLTLIFARPFICSLAFPSLNYLYSFCLFAFLAFWFIYNRPPLKKLQPLAYPLAFFCLALIISILFSKRNLNSFGEFYKYASGLSLFVIAASLNSKERKYAIYAISLSAFIISFLAIHQYLFGFKALSNYVAQQKITDPFIINYIEQKRAFFPFVTPNMLGGYIAMIIPLFFIYKYGFLFVIPVFIALILTKSIGALLVLYLGLTAYFFLVGRLKKKELFFLFGVLIIMAVIFILRSTMQKEYSQPLFSTLARLNYWEEALGVIKKSPLLGVGPGNFDLPQSRYAHNSYLQVWIEMGILGFISFLWLVIMILKSGFVAIKGSAEKRQIAGLICANIIFLIHNLIDFSFFLPEVALLWWIIAGLTYSFSEKDSLIALAI